MSISKENIALLRTLAEKYETVDFLPSDPSQFMHHYEKENDQETMAFIAACLSFGQRKQFLKKIEIIEKEMAGEPFLWIREKRYTQSTLFKGVDLNSSFYRMVTYRDLFTLFAALSDTNLLTLIREGREECSVSNLQRHLATAHLVPKDEKSTCKRLHMFMRWMVRDGSPVDLGIWSKRMNKSALIIPLDTHVYQESLRLGLIDKGGMTLTTARKITEAAKEVFPDDPAKVDFALFGMGVDGQ